MIGSGFSRNARKTRFDARYIPLWRDVANAIFDELYPQSAGGVSNRGPVVTLSVDNVLRLAQEYETAFGRM